MIAFETNIKAKTFLAENAIFHLFITESKSVLFFNLQPALVCKNLQKITTSGEIKRQT